MFIEMAVKNFTLEQIVPGMRDKSIDNIYKTKMNDELSNSDLRLRRLKLRDKLRSALSASYKNKNSMVSHFYNRGEEIPIWGIFEIMTLGDFAVFLLCLNKDARFKDRNANINVIKWVEKDKSLPLPIYNKVVATGIQGKIKKLDAYVKNSYRYLHI